MNLGILLGAAGTLIVLSSKNGKKTASKSLTNNRGILTNYKAGLTQIKIEQNIWPDPVFSIPFGSGIANPLWPIVTSHKNNFTVSYRTIGGEFVGNPARRFMAKRGDEKYHVGIDVYAGHGDAVVASESGQIINIYHFFHDAYAMIVQCNTGLVINYGEVARNSWKEFGVSEGSKIKKGQPIARIGTMSGGSSMLHFETYMKPTSANEKYFGGDAGPILNPTYYLLRARYFSEQGRTYSSTACLARAFQNMPPSNSFEGALSNLEKELHVAPQDSVLAEIVASRFRQSTDLPDRADGP